MQCSANGSGPTSNAREPARSSPNTSSATTRASRGVGRTSVRRARVAKGDLAGLHSIRINDQWRIVFRWTVRGPEEVKIVDYH
ncbi:MAG: plasmid maintenance system killer [Verrucomicrobiaceae bacterium]|nr:plasmid maintenance system killer [Verrucomicrobiaceae bacterium]